MDPTIAISAAGATFHARQRGARPGTIFLHGFGGDLHTWDGVWAELGDAFAALRYDLRGLGRSRNPSPSPIDHAGDLLAILDAAGIDRCDLVGVSMGGSIALNFALDHPERVRRLALISPGLVAWEWSESWLQRWRPIVDRAHEGALDEARRLWWEHPLFAATRDSPAASALYESIRHFGGEQWMEDRQVFKLPDIERLHSLAAPTLLLSGGRDFEDFRLIADLIEAGAPDVTRIDDPARGHLLHMENPAGCARRLLDFLGRAPLSAT